MATGVEFSFLGKTAQSNPAVFADLAERILRDADFRDQFQKEPGRFLKEAGVELPDDVSNRIAGQTLTNYLEKGGDPLGNLLPGAVDLPEHLKGDPIAFGPAVVVVAVAAVAIASTPAVVAYDELMREGGRDKDGKKT